MKKFLILSNQFPPIKGGAEIQAYRLAHALADIGWEVTVITAQSTAQRPQHSRVKVICLGTKNLPKAAGLIYAFLATIIGLWIRPHYILNVLVFDGVCAARALSWLVNAKVVYRIASCGEMFDLQSLPGQPRRYASYIRFLARSKIVVSSSAAAHQLEQNWPSAQVLQIYNICRVPPYSETERKAIVITAGRLIPEKNYQLAIQAFAQKSEGDSWILEIYGDGPCRDQLTLQVRELAIATSIFIYPSTEQLNEKMAAAAIFVLSSDFEGMPNVLIEAMAAGCACIATDVSGVADLIENGVSGIIVPRRDVNALSNAMSQLMRDPELRKKLGIEAWKSVNSKVQPEKIAHEWAAYLKED